MRPLNRFGFMLVPAAAVVGVLTILAGCAPNFDALMEEGDIRGARHACEEMSGPEQNRCRTSLAEHYVDVGDYSSAGKFYLRLGDADSALRAFERGIEHFAGRRDVPAQFRAASCYEGAADIYRDRGDSEKSTQYQLGAGDMYSRAGSTLEAELSRIADGAGARKRLLLVTNAYNAAARAYASAEAAGRAEEARERADYWARKW